MYIEQISTKIDLFTILYYTHIHQNIQIIYKQLNFSTNR